MKLVILQTPDGQDLFVNADNIMAVGPAPNGIIGMATLIIFGGQLAVKGSPKEVAAKLEGTPLLA